MPSHTLRISATSESSVFCFFVGVESPPSEHRVGLLTSRKAILLALLPHLSRHASLNLVWFCSNIFSFSFSVSQSTSYSLALDQVMWILLVGSGGGQAASTYASVSLVAGETKGTSVSIGFLSLGPTLLSRSGCFGSFILGGVIG